MWPAVAEREPIRTNRCCVTPPTTCTVSRNEILVRFTVMSTRWRLCRRKTLIPHQVQRLDPHSTYCTVHRLECMWSRIDVKQADFSIYLIKYNKIMFLCMMNEVGLPTGKEVGCTYTFVRPYVLSKMLIVRQSKYCIY